MKNFKTFGVMIDMSRNAVMNLPALKRFLSLLKKMSYNCVMLYTEDTYEVDGEPYFGYMRGRYSMAEMKEIDEYAAGLGIEMIPCIQTLAHLNAIKRWDIVQFDCDDILLVDDERTYELIDKMFSTLAKCFKSRRIHIGMDEAHMLGRGKHMDIHGAENINSIMKRHLDKICSIAKKYGYEPMMWSDMFFRPWNDGNYYIEERPFPDEYKKALPESVIPVYWDYYHANESDYIAMIKNHRQLSDKTWFAGGTWSWCGLIPSNRFCIKAMLPAIDACRKNRIKDIFFTMWGDDGSECSHFSQLPSLLYLSEYAKGNTDEAKIKSRFKALFGIDYDEYISIDEPNYIDGEDHFPCNPSKYMLYSDYFNNYLDNTVKIGGSSHYKSCAERFKLTARKSKKYGYIFNSASKLCEVLAVKYELGLKTRKAYESGDKDMLKHLADEDYKNLIRLVEDYAAAFEKQWMTDNKPHGFDVQDHRLGALIWRTKSCRRRILDYVSGKTDKIEELDQPLLPYGEKEKSGYFNLAPLHATANIIHHNSWEI